MQISCVTPIVEFEAQTRIEGDIQQLDADFPVIEFFRIVRDNEPGRESDTQVTVFDSVGFALEDFSSLRYLHDQASKYSIGEKIHLVPTPTNIKNLYQLIEDNSNFSSVSSPQKTAGCELSRSIARY
jgi:ornithine cyclodeaminase